MLDLQTDLLKLQCSDRTLLHAYLAQEQALAAERRDESAADDEQRESAPWVVRLRDVEGVPQERLAAVHGRLIAGGYLQFQLHGRDEGLTYRLTPEGRATLLETADVPQVA